MKSYKVANIVLGNEVNDLTVDELKELIKQLHVRIDKIENPEQYERLERMGNYLAEELAIYEGRKNK